MKLFKYMAWFSALMFLGLMTCREIEKLSLLAIPYMAVLAGAFLLLTKELEGEK